MARHILLGKRNLTDLSAAAFTASHESGGLVVENLQTVDVTERWRAGAVSSVSLETDLGAAYDVGLLALINSNITSAATGRVRGATSQANLTAAPGYDSGAGISLWPADTSTAIRGYVNIVHIPSTVQSYRWWRWDLDDAGNGDGYLTAGRSVIQEVVEPDRNFARGAMHGHRDPSVARRSRGGQPTWRTETKSRIRSFELPALTAAEADALDDIDALHGRTLDRAICLQPDDTDRMYRHFMWGPVTELAPFEDVRHQRSVRRFSQEERL